MDNIKIIFLDIKTKQKITEIVEGHYSLSSAIDTIRMKYNYGILVLGVEYADMEDVIAKV